VAPPAVGLASTVKLFLTCDLITLTFRPLNGVTDHPSHGLSSCKFSACYTLPFST